MTTFVLVHGAWHGGWCWARVAKRLRNAGHEVFTPTLTGLGERAHLLSPEIGLETHVRDVIGVLDCERLDDVVLCGHSYGGGVISGVADRAAARIAALVYLDAHVLRDGEAMIDKVNPDRRAQFEAAIDGWRVPPVKAADFALSNPDDIAWVDGLCVDMPLKTFTESLSMTGAGDAIARRAYIRASGFDSPAFDRTMAACCAAGFEMYDIATSHDAMVTAPDELTAILLEYAG